MGWFKPVDGEIQSLRRTIDKLEEHMESLGRLALLQEGEIAKLTLRCNEYDENIRSLLDTLDKITKCYEAIRDGRLP